MKEQIKRIMEETDLPETKIEKTVSISNDGEQFLLRIPKKISDYFEISKKNKLRFTLDIPYTVESRRKIMVVEVIGKKD
jgi:hypothetical protein